MSKPSLALIPTAHIAGKLYSVLPADGSGDFTVTRNGTGTFIGQDGLIKTALANEPRFEYNPDGTFRGVLVEPASTNLITDSTTFAGFGRTRVELINAGGLDSPFGDAFKLIPSSEVGVKLLTRSPGSQPIGTTVTLSIFCKKGELNGIYFYLNDIGSRSTDFNFDTETFSSSSDINGGFQKLNNGWYRIFFTCTLNGNSNSFLISAYNNISGVSYIGNNVDGIFISNPQYEVNSAVTSYIPTINLQVTRPADVITRNNAQDLIGQTEGAIFIDYDKINFGTGARAIATIAANNSSLNNTISILDGIGDASAGRILIQVRFNQTWIVNGLGQTSISSSGKYKICLTYNSTQIKFFINGVLIRTDNHNLVPSEVFSVIGLGNRNGSLNGSGLTKTLSIYKTALTDQQAIALTTL